MKNINFVTRDELLKSLTEKEADEFYKVDSEVFNEMESQTEPVDIPTEVEEQVLRLSESKHDKARSQEKDHRIDIMMEKVRLVLEDYFRDDLENVEKECKENHVMQTKSIEENTKMDIDSQVNDLDDKGADDIENQPYVTKKIRNESKSENKADNNQLFDQKEAYQQLYLSSQVQRME